MATISFYAKNDLHAWLMKKGEKEGVSPSQIIVEILKKKMESEEDGGN